MDVAARGRALLARLARRSRPAASLEVEDLVQARRDVGGDAVVNRLDPDLISDAADVDVLEDAHHALDVRAGVRDDEQVAGAVDRDVAVLRLEVAEDVRDVVGAGVAHAVDARDVAILPRRRLPGDDDRRAHLRVGRVDDLVEPPVWHDRQPVRLEDRQERLVGLGNGHLLGREHRGLDVVDLAPEDEALARQLADDANELRQVGVFEREGDLVPARPRLVVDPRFELREPLRVRGGGSAGADRGLRPRVRAGRRQASRRRGRRGRCGGSGHWKRRRPVGPGALLRERIGPRRGNREVAKEQRGEDFRFHEDGVRSLSTSLSPWWEPPRRRRISRERWWPSGHPRRHSRRPPPVTPRARRW